MFLHKSVENAEDRNLRAFFGRGKKCIIEKENSLETLIEIVENVSPKGFFLTECEELGNFSFTANCRYIYIQPLLIDVTVLLFT